MEHPSSPAHRGHFPWQGLLLAVSLLTFWNPPTTAQLTIESVPTDALEGTDVLLLVHNLPENLLGYVWLKGEGIDPDQQIVIYVIETQENTPWLLYSGRETTYHNGSLLFQNVTRNDTGYYTLQAIDQDFNNAVGTVQLRVYPELTKPNITCNNSNPVEHKDPVVLTCEPETQNTTYLWSINNQSLLDRTWLKLSPDNRTLTLLHVTINDTGPYECETWNPVSACRSDPFYLNVLYDQTSAGLSAGAVGGIVVGVLAGVALIAALVYSRCSRKAEEYDVHYGCSCIFFPEIQLPGIKETNFSLPIPISHRNSLFRS
uniref:Carcinoembryonic antigen-related cell adhesion molecule 50 transcript variant 1 n=1 Tax=Equus caballus TaxID=9796 RepID=F6Z600_HORSE|nr:carcinoembryonic antigen-related cell adhesion molecule 50 transcript variant 1 [Equus caballus]